MGVRRPPTEEIDSIYRRLLTGEPDAPADLIAALLDPLVAELQRSYPTFPDPDLIFDVVTDSLLSFVQAPERYHPDKRSVWGYLKMDAQGDLLNLWESLRRRAAHEIALDAVAHDLPDRNSAVEEMVVRKLAPAGLPEGMDAETLIAQLREAIPDAREWAVVLLMSQGERATDVFAAALGILDKPVADRRRLVKQAKDRIRLRLKRRGVRIHDGSGI